MSTPTPPPTSWLTSFLNGSRIFMPFIAIFLMSSIDFTDERNIDYIRISYSIVQFITLLLYLFFYWKISTSPFNPTEEKFDVVEPSGGTVQMNSQEYDFFQLNQLRNQSVTSLVIILFLHLKWGFIQPLFMQSLLGLTTLLGNPLVQVYVFGESLKRPWSDPEAENPFKKLISSFKELTQEVPEEKKDDDGKEGETEHSKISELKDNEEESEMQEIEENTQERTEELESEERTESEIQETEESQEQEESQDREELQEESQEESQETQKKKKKTEKKNSLIEKNQKK